MTFGFLHTDILSCSSTLLAWSGVLLAKATVLLGAVLVAGTLLGRRHPSMRHLIASLGLLCLLALPILSLSLGFDAAGRNDLAAAVAHEALPNSSAEPLTESVIGLGNTLTSLVMVWGIGAGWLLLRLLADVATLSFHARRRVESIDGVTGARARVLARRIGIRRPVRVLHTEAVDIPYTWGLFRPVIILPRRAVRWTRERLDAVLLHELGHVRRKDALFTVLSRVSCSIFWFHPLVWWVDRRAREDAERCCDSLVVNEGFSAARYARDLLEIVRDARPATVALAPTMAAESQLARRINALIDHVPSAYRVGRLMAAVVLVALFIPTFLLAGVSLPGVVPPRAAPESAACAAGDDLWVSYPDLWPDDQVSEEPGSSVQPDLEPMLESYPIGEEKR